VTAITFGPLGQPISGGCFQPLSDDQKVEIGRRLAEMFPMADPDDFWAKEVRPCAECTDGIFSQRLPCSQPEEG
jgi:hypothetical protein